MTQAGAFELYFDPWAIVFLLTAMLIAMLAAVSWSRRGIPGNTPFALLMAAVGIWLFGRAFEGAVVGMEAKIFWAKIEYLGIPWVGLLWLLLAMSYSRRTGWITRKNLILLSIIPVTTVLVTMTNEFHGLTWPKIVPSPETDGKTLIYSHGPWFWIYAAYSYVFIVMGTVQMLQTAIRARHVYKNQATAMFIGAVLPISMNLLYLAGQSPVRGMDLTPFGFAFSGVIYAWTIFRFQLFQLLPVAREMLIDKMNDGILVLDEEENIIDRNMAAKRLLHLPQGKIIGKPAREILAEYPRVLKALGGAQEEHFELHQEGREEALLDIRMIPLFDTVVHKRGALLVIRDDTHHKLVEQKMEQLIREEQKWGEQLDFLHTITAELTTEFDLTQLLQKIMDRAISLMEVTAGELALYDDERKDLEIVVFRGVDEDHTGDRMALGEGVMGTVAMTREPLCIDDYAAWAGRSDAYEGVGSYATLGMPMLAGDKLMGVFAVGIETDIRTFQEKDIELLSIFASQAALAILNARMYRRMELLATTDPLTGLFNRRQFFLRAQIEFERARRYGTNLSALMIDLDQFKMINDQYGHLSGDQVLVEMARVCQESLRVVDILGRYGGEEFVVLLPETDIDIAFDVAERLREEIAGMSVETKGGLLQLTVSVGVASPLGVEETLETLLDKADTALYAAKQAGRNCVKIYSRLPE